MGLSCIYRLYKYLSERRNHGFVKLLKTGAIGFAVLCAVALCAVLVVLEIRGLSLYLLYVLFWWFTIGFSA